jgi:hypothetical protein
MKQQLGYFVLIGDMAASRQHSDRLALQERLLRALASINAAVQTEHPLRVTLGDEFQGVYSAFSSAADAALLARLEMMDVVQVRVGIGWGAIPVRSDNTAPFGQDGPAWWAARDSLDLLRSLENKQVWQHHWLTAFACDDKDRAALVNSMLMCRDQLLAGFDERDARALLGLFRGETQKQIATALGVTQSAVAQRQRRNGSFAVFRAHARLKEVTQWRL